MGKIISMNDYNDFYSQKLVEAFVLLQAMEDRLQEKAVNLATTGKWKEWSSTIEIGTVFYFDEGMILNTGDDNVNQLMELRFKVIEVKEKLEKQIRFKTNTPF